MEDEEDKWQGEINSNKLHLVPELISIADYEITTIAIKFNSTLIIALGHYCTGALHNKLTIMIRVISIACNHLGMML